MDLLDILDQTASISRNLDYLIQAGICMYIMGFLLGYGSSISKGIKNTMSISFFLVMFAGMAVLFIGSLSVFVQSCFLHSEAQCFQSFESVIHLTRWIIFSSLDFFVNIIIGYAGVLSGVCFFYPTEWIMQRFFSISLHQIYRDTKQLA